MLLIGVPQVAAMTIQHHDTNTKIDTSYTCVFMRAISYTDGTVCAINDAAEPTYQPVSNVSDQTPRLLNYEQRTPRDRTRHRATHNNTQGGRRWLA